MGTLEFNLLISAIFKSPFKIKGYVPIFSAGDVQTLKVTYETQYQLRKFLKFFT